MQPIREDELHAYIDGALNPGRRAEIEAYLASHPAEAARAEAYRSQNLGLHALYSGRIEEAVPLEFVALAADVDRSLRRRRRRRKILRWLSAGGLGAAMAGAGWLMHGAAVPAGDFARVFTRQAMEAHMASIRSVESSSAAAEGGAFVLWLSSASRDVSFRAPDLNPMGFRLVEEHVLQDADMPTAQLVYRDRKENIVTLYFGATEESSEIAPTFIGDGELPQLHWRDHGFAYSIVGLIDHKQMLDIVRRTGRDFGPTTTRTDEGSGASPAESTDMPISASEPAENAATMKVRSPAATEPPIIQETVKAEQG